MCHVWKSIQIINLILVTISGNRSDRIRYTFVLMWRKFYCEISTPRMYWMQLSHKSFHITSYMHGLSVQTNTHHFTFQEILCVFKAQYILISHWTVIISHVSLFGLVIGQTLMLSEGRHPLASSVDAIATYLRNLKPSHWLTGVGANDDDEKYQTNANAMTFIVKIYPF